MSDTYESWRITFQSSEAAARSAYKDAMRLAGELADAKDWLTRYERGDASAWGALKAEVVELRKKLEQADARYASLRRHAFALQGMPTDQTEPPL